MESKKINQLATSVSPQTSDLTIIGDPVTGVSKKITLLQIANLFATTGTVSSVAVTETGDALTITGSPITSAGTINIGFAGDATQYVRGDGALADFPTSTGGGSSVSYYLNSSVSQGTIGGVAYRELSKDPISGAGTDITISANGYVASYITDANDPSLLEVPGGNFNCEFYFSVNSNNHDPSFYAELYKYDGSTFTLLGSSQSVPEYLSNGTTLSPYYFAIPVATAALTITDRLAIRIYVNVDGRVVTLHTENNHLCQVVTTFSKGLISLNNLTRQNQFFATGTSGTDFAISSATATHTFNLPVASATNTGKLSSTDWSTFNGKVPYTGATASVDLGVYALSAGDISASNLNAIGLGTQCGYLFLKQGTAFLGGGLGYSSINASATKFLLTANVSGANNKEAIFELGSLTNNTQRTFTLPDASGTIALTSNLNSYVPYTGATANVDLGIYNIFSSFVYAEGAGGSSNGGVLIKQYSGALAANSGYTSLFATPNQLGINFSGVYNTFIQSGTLTASRTFTLPDITGTLALLEGTQTFSGSKTFSATTLVNTIYIDGVSYLKNLTTTSYITGYTTYSAKANGVIEYFFPSSFKSVLDFNDAADYTYTFPASTGTLALTSDLSGYVTLATTQTISGAKTFSSSPIIDNGTSGIPLRFKQYSSTNFGLAGYTDIIPIGATLIAFAFGQTGADTKIAYFSAASLTNNVPQEYTLPNATGTIALLSGTQTFTGATTFSLDLTVNSVKVGRGNGSISTNSVLGETALNSNTTGSTNTAIGYGALQLNTTGLSNTAIGHAALNYNTTSSWNTAVGVSALGLSTGGQNTAIGYAALGNNTTGVFNIAIGYTTGTSIVTGNYNTIIGNYAGTAAMSNNIVLADGQGNIRYQWDGTNNVFGNPISGTSATFSGSLGVNSTIRSTGQTDPASGVGMELFYRSADTSSYIQSYDRTNGAWKDVRIYGNTLYFGSQGTNNLTIASTGAASFNAGTQNVAMQVTSNNSNGTILGLVNTNGGPYSWGLNAYSNGTLFFQYGTLGAGSNPFYITSAGAATFSSSVSSPVVKLSDSTLSGAGNFEFTSEAFFGARFQSNAYKFMAGNNTSEYMRITSAGNLAIGTGVASVKLTVSNPANGDIAAFTNTNDADFYINLTSGVARLASGTNILALGSNNTERMRITSSGVTISNLAGTGSRAVLADANGLLSAPVSDISVKENITTIGYGLNEILKMNPVWFDFIDEYKNYGEGRQNGNIAQEMQEIIPEAVFVTPSTGKMGINYDQLHAVYIKAIQELKAEIEQLKNK